MIPTPSPLHPTPSSLHPTHTPTYVHAHPHIHMIPTPPPTHPPTHTCTHPHPTSNPSTLTLTPNPHMPHAHTLTCTHTPHPPACTHTSIPPHPQSTSDSHLIPPTPPHFTPPTCHSHFKHMLTAGDVQVVWLKEAQKSCSVVEFGVLKAFERNTSYCPLVSSAYYENKMEEMGAQCTVASYSLIHIHIL